MINLLADILSVFVVCSFLIIIIIRKNSKIKELKFVLNLKREECINLRNTLDAKNKKNSTLYEIKILYGDILKKYETFNNVKSMRFNRNNNMLILECLDKTKYIKMDTIMSIDKEEVQNA